MRGRRRLWRGPLLLVRPQWRSNMADTAAAVKASECSSLPPLWARCLGSASGVAAGGFQSARAARDPFPQAATCRAVQFGGTALRQEAGDGREALVHHASTPKQAPQASTHQHLFREVALPFFAARGCQLRAEALQSVRAHVRQGGEHPRGSRAAGQGASGAGVGQGSLGGGACSALGMQAGPLAGTLRLCYKPRPSSPPGCCLAPRALQAVCHANSTSGNFVREYFRNRTRPIRTVELGQQGGGTGGGSPGVVGLLQQDVSDEAHDVGLVGGHRLRGGRGGVGLCVCV